MRLTDTFAVRQSNRHGFGMPIWKAPSKLAKEFYAWASSALAKSCHCWVVLAGNHRHAIVIFHRGLQCNSNSIREEQHLKLRGPANAKHRLPFEMVRLNLVSNRGCLPALPSDCAARALGEFAPSDSPPSRTPLSAIGANKAPTPADVKGRTDELRAEDLGGGGVDVAPAFLRISGQRRPPRSKGVNPYSQK